MDKIEKINKAETYSSSTSTRVQKGPYTIDMHPKKTREMLNAGIIFSIWRNNPTRISALFAMIPSNFSGIIDIEAEEVRRQSEIGGHPEAHFNKE